LFVVSILLAYLEWKRRVSNRAKELPPDYELDAPPKYTPDADAESEQVLEGLGSLYNLNRDHGAQITR
jgi:hypothetical protein